MLNKESLANAIKAAFDAESDKEINPAEARARIANSIADAVFNFVTSATITVAGVTTAGTAAAQTQTVPVTATIQ